MLAISLTAGALGGLVEFGVSPVSAAQTGGNASGSMLFNQRWSMFVARFVTEDGRVVDNANGGISHSESQGNGLVLAAFAGDRQTFYKIWRFTQRELQIRGDGLFAWKFDPTASPQVPDLNNATDGDLLIAWGLLEGATRFGDPSLRDKARDLAKAIWTQATQDSLLGPLLKPGVTGFSPSDRKDGPVVNLSYWVFPVLEKLKSVDPEHDWHQLSLSGLKLLQSARFGAKRLPTEWIALGGDVVRPAEGFSADFGYNAIRVPLYLVLAGYLDQRVLGPFSDLWRGQAAGVVDVASGQLTQVMSDPGYRAVVDLVSCASLQQHSVGSLPGNADDTYYYPATLHLLALIASNQRIKSCS